MTNIIGILAGGVGKRLWPISDEAGKANVKVIKQKSLIEHNIEFISSLNYGELIAIGSCNFPSSNLMHQIIEPAPKDTANAIVTLSLFVAEQFPNCNLLVMPSDQLIIDREKFTQSLATLEDKILHHDIILFAVNPEEIRTDYGYIIEQDDRVTFIEKPERSIAEKLIASGARWNAGIFYLNPTKLLSLYRNMYPEEFEIIKSSFDNRIKYDGYSILAKDYLTLIPNSFDRKFVEKSHKVGVINLDTKLKDFGNIIDYGKNVGNIIDEDNIVEGNKVTFIKSSQNLVINQGSQEIRIIGLDNVAVVVNEKGILVASKEKLDLLKL